MPQLIRSDCERIINKLEEFGFPGALRGMPRDQQLREFLGRSRKQLLVAMKEATSGHGFDAIIEHEYNTLANDNARMAYTIACLAYMHGAPVHRRHLIACLEGTDVEKANTLERDLQGVVLSWKGNEELMSPRHRIIAEHVATGAATFEIRQEAIKRFLIQVSSEVNAQNIRRRTPEFIAYRAIINFDNMQRLFGEDRDETDSIYNELVPYYGDDYLFWLQYGRAEVYFNNFSVAENYLNQSLGIREAGNFQAKHYLGVLHLKRAVFQQDAALAAADAGRGEEILREQINERGASDPYPYSALLTHKLRYLKKYQPATMSIQLEDLKNLAQTAIQRHPLEQTVKESFSEVLREYMMQTVRSPQESAYDAEDFNQSFDRN